MWVVSCRSCSAERDRGAAISDLLQLNHLGVDAFGVVGGVDLFEDGVQGFELEGVDAGLVHAGGVEVAGELAGGTFGQRCGFGEVVFGDGAEAGVGFVLRDDADGPPGFVGGHGMVCAPLAVGVGVEVGAGVGAAVDVRDWDAAYLSVQDGGEG